MGSVFRARDLQLGRDVALKLVPLAGAEPRSVERFRREGEITGALQHPGIVRVYAAGQHGAHAFIAYELVEGAHRLGEVFPRLALDGRVRLLVQAAQALGHAHAQGVVHRDVKPDNLLVDAQGLLRVADFGLAAATWHERLTRTGAVVGTPWYMAPEQLDSGGASLGPPTDVWALGVILYEALTGEVPFSGESVLELWAQIARARPRPPRSLDAGVPRPLEQVCLRALAGDPTRRYPDGRAFAEALEAAAAGKGRAETPRGWLPALGVLAAVLICGLGGLLAWPREPEAVAAAEPAPTSEPTRARASLPEPCSWRLVPGQRYRGCLTNRLEEIPLAGDGHAGRHRIELWVAQEVQAVTGGVASINATLERIRLDVDELFRGTFDSREGQSGAMAQAVGRHFRYQLVLRTGEVRELSGLTRIIEGVLTALPKYFREGATATLSEIDNRRMTQQLNALQHLIPAEAVSEHASWEMSRYFDWNRRSSRLRGRCRVERQGEDGLRASLLDFELFSSPGGSTFDHFDMRGEARFAQGRLREGWVSSEVLHREADGRRYESRWRFSYEESPAEDGGTPGK